MGQIDKARKALATLREMDPTGGVRIADCNHGFRDMLLVRTVRHEWHFILSANIQCWKCDESGGNVISHAVNNCPLCGCDLNGAKAALSDTPPGAPVRNYILGQNEAVDMHLLGIGAFNKVAPE